MVCILKKTFSEPSFLKLKSLKVLMAEFPQADTLPIPIIKTHNRKNRLK